MMQNYRKLMVWSKSMDLVDNIYLLTQLYPKDERFALVTQTKRAAVSIPSNIAEGSQRGSDKEFIRFLNIAYASLAEVETQIEIAHRQHYINQKQLEDCFSMTAETGKMLNGLLASIKQRLSANSANRQLQPAN